MQCCHSTCFSRSRAVIWAAGSGHYSRTGSKLDQLAAKEGWYARLPMWDWVGGRTSVFSAVGLLPAALQGIDLKELLDGAKLMDQQGRQEDLSSNPAAQLALNWWYAGNGRGEKAMVCCP